MVMDTRREEFRIVQVTSHCRLRDTDGEEHIYWRRNGRGVEPGWFGVTWPAGGVCDRFDEATVFHGPYVTRAEALSAMSIAGGAAAPASRASVGQVVDYYRSQPGSRTDPS